MLNDIVKSYKLVAAEVFSDFKQDILSSLLCEEEALHTEEDIISWFTNLKTHASLDVIPCHISELDQWKITNDAISHADNKYFQVIGISAEIGSREVASWCQPIVQQIEEGIIGFILKKINGVYHVLMQAKLEAGNFDLLEMAPTVQCITGSYTGPNDKVSYLNHFIKSKDVHIHYDAFQSEEGGRFFHEQNRNMVIEVRDEFPNDVEENFIWMTFRQMKEFIKYNNYLNVEARSLLACISPI